MTLDALQAAYDAQVDMVRISDLHSRIRRQRTAQLRRNRKIHAPSPVVSYYDKDADLRNFNYWKEQNERYQADLSKLPQSSRDLTKNPLPMLTKAGNRKLQQMLRDSKRVSQVRPVSRRVAQQRADLRFHTKMRNAGF